MKCIPFLIAMLGSIVLPNICNAQQTEQICVQIFDTSSGVTVIKCNPVSPSNPFPTKAQ
jgi:hypothetical protein